MNKILLAFSSRTFWTIVIAFLFNGFQATNGAFSPAVVDTINGIFSILAVVFHVNPSQNYTQPQ
jgi:hypothetical protein